QTFISVCDLGSGEEWLSSVGFDVMADGGIRILAVVFIPSEKEDENDVPKEFRFLDFDKDGNLLTSMVIEQDLDLSAIWSPATFMAVDAGGNTLVIRNGLYFFAADGKFISQAPFEQSSQSGVNSIARSANGDLWLCTFTTPSGASLKKVDVTKGKLTDQELGKEQFFNVGSITEGPVGERKEADIALQTSDKLFLYNETTKQLTELLDWSSCGVQGSDIKSFGVSGDKLLAISYSRKTLYVIEPEGGGDREVVVLATISRTSLNQMVAAYNSSQTKYLVKVVEYGGLVSSSLEWQDPANRMMMDILGDSPPDLIDLSHFIQVSLNPTVQDFVEKGYVEDLWPYLDRSETLKRDDFEEKAMEICSHKGVLAAIPTAYAISTMGVSSEELGKRSSWSVEDLIAYDKAHPEEPLIDNCQAQNIFTICISPNLEAFVDFDAKTADFDTPQFRTMIEYAKTYPYGDGGIIYLNAPEHLVRFEDVESLIGIEKILNTHFDGKAQFIGYPSLDGKPLSFLHLAADGKALAICRNATEKEGAWDFIEYVQNMELLDQTEGTYSFSLERYTGSYAGIPARKVVLEKVLGKLGEEKDQYLTEIYPDGTKFEYYPFGDAETAVFRELLENSRVADYRIKEVRVIVYEELCEYFAGQKSADAVIDVINQRVNLYLREN
ncbi:MAG: hypothetical protein K6F31_09120, partial [Acetatifactor sp.]|nr:hypothetical protein [Acetatifactor sp.]